MCDEQISVESMKMEVRIPAPRSGKIVTLLIKVGQTLDVGEVICVIADEEVARTD